MQNAQCKMQSEGIAKGDLLKSFTKQISPLCIPLWRCGEGYIGEGGSLCAGDDDTFTVAVPGSRFASQSRLASCRPLPLAQVAPSATGGAPIASLCRFFAFFLAETRKEGRRQAPAVGCCKKVKFICTNRRQPLSQKPVSKNRFLPAPLRGKPRLRCNIH